MKFLIDKLEIEGFRGINEQVVIKFTKPVVLIYGDNFSGKSSILGAIEWCLFNKLKFIEYETRKQEEIVNDFHPVEAAKVKIYLRNNKGQEFIFVRNRRKDTIKSDFAIIGEREEYRGKKAERYVYSILNLTLDDFLRTVFLHQEAISAVLTEKISERSKGMDKLLGLEDFVNILEVIGKGIKEIEIAIKKLTDQQKRLSTKIETAYETLESEIQTFIKDLKKHKVKESDISLSYCLEELKKIKEKLLELDRPTTERVFPHYEASIQDIERKLFLITKCIRKCRNNIFKRLRFDELEEKRNTLLELTGRIERIIEKENELNNKRKRLLKSYKSKEAIQRRKSEIEVLISSKEAEIRNLDLKYKILKDTYEYLQSVKDGKCIICNQPVKLEKLRNSIELRIKKLKDLKPGKLAKLSEEVEKYREKFKTIQNVLKEVEETEKELSKLNKNKSELVEEINWKFNRQDRNFLECSKFVRRELNKTEREIKKAKRPLREKSKIFDELSNKLDIIKTIIKVLSMKKRKGELSERYKSDKKEIKTIKFRIEELMNFSNQLNTIKNILTTYHKDIAQDLLNKAQEKVDSIYRKLVGHPYFDHLQIEIKSEEKRGVIRNNYYIKVFNKRENKYSLATSRLSRAGMNCVALALFLSLATTLSTRTGFIVIDSPSQELDSKHKENLVKIIKNLSRKKTFILATSDREFKELLEKIISNDLQLIILGKWSRKGVVIE